MLISKQWLSEFVKLPKAVSDADIARAVTLSTVEVEKTIDQSETMDKMVVGLVKTVAPHPNADKLKICQVDVGVFSPAKGEPRGGDRRIAQIVCGGTNVAEGMKVAVALPGSRVRWHGEGDLVELAKTKIRGEESEGMICAGAEIGIEKSNEGEHEIMDLSGLDVPAGTSLAEALGRDDVIFEIEHKSLTNRPDLMGHYGMAREVAALFRAPLTPYEPPAPHAPKTTKSPLTVTVEDKRLCPRYMAVAVEGVKVAPSPAWLRNRLLSCGVRSVNNVVDVTNYVLLELGQPMHAFDADKIGGGNVEIRVRTAKNGEKIACLDDATYELTQEDLLITDGRKTPIAIAGVMGGMDSAVTDATTRIVFESANFSPVSVRKTSSRLALRSESSARFEKSLDPEQCELALRRAVQLLRDLCPESRVASQVADAYPNPPKPVVIEMAASEIAERLGSDIPDKDAMDILSRLGFSTKGTAKTLLVTVPSWRATKDVSIREDIIEEVARVWGYDRIPSSLPSFPIVAPAQDPVRLLARRLRHALAARFNATEAYRYAFVSPETLRALGLDVAGHLALANPLADDRPYLVRSLIPNLLESVATNQHMFSTVSLFEIDRVFIGDQDGEEDGQGGRLPAQPYHLAVAHSVQGDERPFISARAMVEEMLSAEGFAVSFVAVSKPDAWMHAGRSAEILVDDKRIGIVAEVVSEAASALGIDRRAAVIEINLSSLSLTPSRLPAFASLPQFPDAKRDLAFIVDDQIPYAEVEKSLHAASPIIVSIELFDVYRGKGVEEGKKSLAVHLVLRAKDRTLASAEAETEVAKLVKVIESAFHGTIRA